MLIYECCVQHVFSPGAYNAVKTALTDIDGKSSSIMTSKVNDVAQETAANYVTLKIIILTSSIKRWIGCRLI